MIKAKGAIQFLDLIEEKQRERYAPSHTTFELTPYCNFRCPMCYVRTDDLGAGANMLGTEDWIELARQAQEAGCMRLVLTGGEIFTRKDIRKIYESAYDMGFLITLMTNGYLIDDEIINWLRRKKPFFVKITIYGASNETYRKVCGIANGYTKVTENILKLREAGIQVLTCMTVIRENENDLEAVGEWTKSHGLGFSYSKQIKQPVRGIGREVSNVRIQPDASENEVAELEYIDVIFPKRDHRPFSSCKAYKTSCIINWKGEMLGCNFITSTMVNALENSITNNFRKLWDMLDAIKTPKKCLSCKYLQFCNPCPGTLEGECGDPERISPYVCASARERYENCLLKGRTQTAPQDECE